MTDSEIDCIYDCVDILAKGGLYSVIDKGLETMCDMTFQMNDDRIFTVLTATLPFKYKLLVRERFFNNIARMYCRKKDLIGLE